MLRSLPRVLAASVVLLLVPLCFVSCRKKTSDVLGKAYVAPATLKLRSDLTEKNSTVAVLKHGEEVSIIDQRRIFLEVRTAAGAEGWLSSYDLLTSGEMQQIGRERLHARTLPPQGEATVFGPLNMHIEPSRGSPAFAQIHPGEVVQVLAHRMAPRTNHRPKRAAFVVLRARPKPPPPERRKMRLLPPPPPAPPLPPNWKQMSGNPIEEQAAQPEKKPVAMEDWTLVRTSSDVTGWALSRNLFMKIPRDVEQYAEGKRITAYFDLGAVTDTKLGIVKHDWLWTTASKVESCDFNGWRVFLWSLNHHRYETSYRQRDVQGYFPIHVDPAESGKQGRTFELILKDDEGKLCRRTYWFDGVRVHLVGTENASSRRHRAAAVMPKKPAPKRAKPSWWRRRWVALKSEF
ncbi:MAG: SH3 domain-containing protein [Bryobacteraceae bacterium]